MLYYVIKQDFENRCDNRANEDMLEWCSTCIGVVRQ